MPRRVIGVVAGVKSAQADNSVGRSQEIATADNDGVVENTRWGLLRGDIAARISWRSSCHYRSQLTGTDEGRLTSLKSKLDILSSPKLDNRRLPSYAAFSSAGKLILG